MLYTQPYHLVEPSPWPILASSSALFSTMGLINWFHYNSKTLMFMGLLIMLMSSMQWWRDIIREATFTGKHTIPVQMGLRIGMVLFIISEICFFLAFFWTFFHSSLAPNPEMGCQWPPMGIIAINPFSIPMLNTAVLLASGFTITWAHHAMIMMKRKEIIYAMVLTITLGVYFTILQLSEYKESSFSIADSVYGSIFFIATGFHGMHVLIGSIFLLTTFIRIMMNHFSNLHHFGFEASAWYWHFVDVVWICLYSCIYWWGF